MRHATQSKVKKYTYRTVGALLAALIGMAVGTTIAAQSKPDPRVSYMSCEVKQNPSTPTEDGDYAGGHTRCGVGGEF